MGRCASKNMLESVIYTAQGTTVVVLGKSTTDSLGLEADSVGTYCAT
jgi:hypothetical protein